MPRQLGPGWRALPVLATAWSPSLLAASRATAASTQRSVLAIVHARGACC
jgi:hypothetical protein